jgi:hypothetical protein
MAEESDMFHSDSDPLQMLEVLVTDMATLDGIQDVFLTKLIKLVGDQLNKEIKAEANYYRSKRSREFEGSYFT